MSPPILNHGDSVARQREPHLARFITTLAASIVVGAGSSYMTGSKMLAVQQTRIDEHDHKLEDNRNGISKLGEETKIAVARLDAEDKALHTEINTTRERLFDAVTNVRIDIGSLRTLIEERIKK